MKDAVWLACCPRNERRIVQREIESREVGARLLWLDGVLLGRCSRHYPSRLMAW